MAWRTDNQRNKVCLVVLETSISFLCVENQIKMPFPGLGENGKDDDWEKKLDKDDEGEKKPRQHFPTTRQINDKAAGVNITHGRIVNFGESESVPECVTNLHKGQCLRCLVLCLTMVLNQLCGAWIQLKSWFIFTSARLEEMDHSELTSRPPFFSPFSLNATTMVGKTEELVTVQCLDGQQRQLLSMMHGNYLGCDLSSPLTWFSLSWLLPLFLVTLSFGSSWFLPLIHTLTYIDNKKLQTACVGDKIACKSIFVKTILQLALTGDLLSCYSALVYMRQGKTPLLLALHCTVQSLVIISIISPRLRLMQ